jgi:hypothetical protein
VAGFVVQAEGALLRWLVRATLGEAQAAPVLRALDQGGDLLLRILRHPLPFLQNLVSAGWRGFQNFLKNGPRHLLASVQEWLLGGLARAGLHLPARLDLAGVMDLLLQVFDLTKTALLGRLRRRLAAVLGPERLARLEDVLTQVGGVALVLWQRGPAAAWQAIAQQAGDLKAQALDFVQQQVLGVAARAVPVFLATLAVPGGAFVQVARGIYNGVLTFVEKGKQIAQVGTALLGSVSAIAAGQLAPAAQAVETTLVKVLPVALSFLARWLGLDGISGAIQTGLQKVQAPVERAVGKVLDAVVDKAKALWGAVKGGAGKAVDQGRQGAAAVGGKVAGWLGLRKPFAVGKENHALFFEQQDGQSQMMLASTPQPYRNFLASIGGHLAHFSPPATAAYQAARPIAQKIDQQLKESRRERTDLTPAIVALLDALAPHTVVLLQEQEKFAAAATPTAGPGTYRVALAGKTPVAGFGRSMTLTFSGPAIAAQTGSPPTQAFRHQGVFADLDLRRHGQSTYYVLGHLLNDNLGGTGKDMQNLTPLFRNSNTLHETRIEKKVKEFKEQAVQGADLIVVYSVVPTYGRPVNTGLIQQLKIDGDPEADLKEKIITAEQYVPLNLVCHLHTLSPVNPGLMLHPQSLTLRNDITQGPHEYQIDPTIKRKQKLHSTTADVLVKAGFTPTEASLIRAAAKSNGYKSFKDESHLLGLITATQLLDVAHHKAFATRLTALVANERVSL